MTPDELETAIRAGDVQRCKVLLSAASEPERRAAAPMVQRLQRAAWERQINQPDSSGIPLPSDRQALERLATAAAAAVGGTCTLAEIKQLGWSAWHLPDAAFDLLELRQPAWLAAWADWALEQNVMWQRVRLLVRQKRIPKPASDAYTTAMLACYRRESPITLLKDDPELLTDDVWRLFRVEGSGENSLAARDKYTRDELTWSRALITLANEGLLPRNRLLDESLGALTRDFAQFRVAWFAHFHEALAPTLEERAGRLEQYLALLASPIPPTVSFSLKALTVLDKADLVPAASYVGHAAPALGAREKGTVKSALRLLDRAARRDPAVASAVATLSCEALLHESPDVQEAGFKLITRYGVRNDPELADLVRARLEDLAASQRPAVEAWLGAVPSASAEAAPVFDLGELEARIQALPTDLSAVAGVEPALKAAQAGQLSPAPLQLNDLRIPKLCREATIKPIVTVDELIERFSALIENSDSPDEIERVLDGVSRLCDRRPEDFDRLTAPLRKRAAKLAARGDLPWLGWFSRDLPDLALVWLGEPIPKRRRWNSGEPNFFLGERHLELARRVDAQTPAPLLSAPTHSGGWIDPLVLVERLIAWPAGGKLPTHDAHLALLRLAPDHRAAALGAAADFPGELGAALRYALGGDEAIGPTAALWIAASRARNPYAEDPAVEARHPQRGPDATCSCRPAIQVERWTYKDRDKVHVAFRLSVAVDPPVPKTAKADTPTVLLHLKAEADAPTLRWLSTLWPAGREAWFTRGCACIGENLDWWEANWPYRIYLEALLEPDTDLNGMGGQLLGLGLGAKEPGESGLATDALIAAIDDGRVTASSLGEILATLAGLGAHSTIEPLKPGGIMNGSRWSKTLGSASRNSPLHAEVVHGALLRLFGSAPSFRPADLVALLELLYELSITIGAAIDPPAARSYLTAIKGGKSGKLAQALVALTANPQRPHLVQAAIQALTGRVERAERWNAMQLQCHGEESGHAHA